VIWLLVAFGTFGLNVVPAFMPPTWLLLAWVHIQFGLPILPLAAVGAAGATLGRFVLARGSSRFGGRFAPERWKANITALADELGRHRVVALPSLVLFMLGPVPSNHLFIAAGLSGAPLAPMLAVFGISRFVSYLLWIGATTAVADSLQEVLSPVSSGWGAVAIQAAGIAVLIAVMQVDWARVLRRFGLGSPARPMEPGEPSPPVPPQ
jgi:membrane protein YqaA with SNARE-associated domain